ncbi:MAG: hypothetical protein ACLUFV_08850 [Acutalibacteraceae bacterium]
MSRSSICAQSAIQAEATADREQAVLAYALRYRRTDDWTPGTDRFG